jgi:hypothetical protein
VASLAADLAKQALLFEKRGKNFGYLAGRLNQNLFARRLELLGSLLGGTL